MLAQPSWVPLAEYTGLPARVRHFSHSCGTFGPNVAE